MSVKNPVRFLVSAFVALLLPISLALPGCGSDDGGGGGGKPKTDAGTGGVGGQGGAGGAGATTGGVCFLTNCSSDQECAGCSFDRTKCDTATKRCIACNPSTGEGCPPGKTCSSFGTCADKECLTDAQGEPTITCTSNSDCLGCDPAHQLCDTATSKCVACTDTNTSLCKPTDVCENNKCANKCPGSCSTDNECSRCETAAGKKAKGCFNHVCAECSDTYACPTGLECKKGTCVKPCGLPGSTSGACTDDTNCEGCGDATNPWKCKFPINGGVYGTCSPSAAGCSDLGPGVAVLPAPFDKVTNTCSKDDDCKGVGIQYNVGEAIRDLIGGPEIDVAGKKIKIQDANVNYNMPACASVKITESIKCGVCVPCREDKDCAKIEIDPLISSLFKGDPLATIAGKLLIDLLYGSNKDHSLHFQCLEIAGGYGVCIPCANPTKACGDTGGGTGGACEGTTGGHSPCVAGGPLKSTCDACTAEVCKADAFCCGGSDGTGTWDSLCVDQAKKVCPACGGGTGGTCDHGPCVEGTALAESCGACEKAVCQGDAFCCDGQFGKWDSYCVADAKTTPGCSCP